MQDFSGHYGQLNAIKVHDVRTSAGNIVRALRDSFTMYVLQSCNVCTIKRSSCSSSCNVCKIEQLSCFHLTTALQTSCDNVFCIWNAAVLCQQLCDCLKNYLEMPCDGILLAANCPPWACHEKSCWRRLFVTICAQAIYDSKFWQSYSNRINNVRLLLEVVGDRTSKIGLSKVFEHVQNFSSAILTLVANRSYHQSFMVVPPVVNERL